MKHHECARKRAFRSSERLVRAKKRDGQSCKHVNWDDCRSKVGRVRFCIVPRGPVRLGRLSGSWGDSRPSPSTDYTGLATSASSSQMRRRGIPTPTIANVDDRHVIAVQLEVTTLLPDVDAHSAGPGFLSRFFFPPGHF